MEQKYISFSGGVESTTMCVLYGHSARAIFCDTGFEHAALYEHIRTVEGKLKEFHPGFELIRVKGDVPINGERVDSLYEYILKSKYYPSSMGRYCTRMFKIEPIDKFLADAGECELMIGLNADEGDRIGNHGNMKNIKYSYPLLKNGVNRDSCIKILKKLDLYPDYPVYMSRGGCVGCFFKSKKEFKAMAALNPQEFDNVMWLEEAIQDERGKYFRIRKNMPRLRELKTEVESALFKPEEMYLTEGIFTPCGVFCHR